LSADTLEQRVARDAIGTVRAEYRVRWLNPSYPCLMPTPQSAAALAAARVRHEYDDVQADTHGVGTHAWSINRPSQCPGGIHPSGKAIFRTTLNVSLSSREHRIAVANRANRDSLHE
jgi:hypothetical protein